MNKYVVYNQETESYLDCGASAFHVNERDVWVTDPDNATLFNSIEELWEYFIDFEYKASVVVLRVDVNVVPDFHKDYFAVKEEEAVNAMHTIIDDENLSHSEKDQMLEWIKKQGGDQLVFKDVVDLVKQAYRIYANAGAEHPSVNSRTFPQNKPTKKPKVKKRDRAPQTKLGSEDKHNPKKSAFI